MSFEPSALSVFLFITALLSFWLGVYALRQQITPFARYYAGLMFSGTAYALGYSLELCTQDAMHMWAMLRIQYLGIPFVPFFWIGLAWSYLEPRGMPERWRWLLLGISGTLFLAFQSNPLHSAFYTWLEFTRHDGITISHAGKGVFYWLNIAYLNIGTSIGVALLFRAWQQAIPLYRKQALLLLAGSLLPWAFHLLYQLGLSPRGIDMSPFGLAATGAAFAVASLRHRVFNVLPLARDIVFDSIAEGVIVLDSRHCIIDFNRAATRLFPRLGLSLIGANYSTLSDDADFASAISTTKPFVHAADKRHLEIRSYPLQGNSETRVGTALLIQDISEKQILIEELRKLASIDELTQVCNRRHLIELSTREIQLAARHGRPLSVIILDVDDFKAINDRHGHLAGDQMLREVARTLRKQLRTTDILGRYGGDEFIICLPETPGSHAHLIADKLGLACAQECGAHLSFGVADISPSAQNFADLLKNADWALYQSKRAGKNRVTLFDQETRAVTP